MQICLRYKRQLKSIFTTTEVHLWFLIYCPRDGATSALPIIILTQCMYLIALITTMVGRMKVNTQYEVTATQTIQGNILEDQTIRLTSEKGKKCPIPQHRIRFIRQEDEKEITLISNDLKSPAEEIMAMYKQRWQIELFFKWIKQNLKIKRFFGTSEQAVHLQVLVAMIAYLLLKLVNNSLGTFQVSLQQLTRLIAVNLFQRKSILELIASIKQKRKPPNPRQCMQLELDFA